MRWGNIVVPGGITTWLRMFSAPRLGGYMPEMIVVLAGAQTGALDQTCR